MRIKSSLLGRVQINQTGLNPCCIVVWAFWNNLWGGSIYLSERRALKDWNLA